MTASSNGHAMNSADFDCPSCGHHFLQGDGGETGGMCEPCFEAELQKAHEQAAKAEVKDARSRIGDREILGECASRTVSRKIATSKICGTA